MLDPEILENYLPVPGEDEVYMVIDEDGNIVQYRHRTQQKDGSWKWEDVTSEIPDNYEPVSGLKDVYKVVNADGNVVAEGRTDKNGIAKFTLRYGKYTYQEFDAPDGYQIDEKEYPFEISEDGQVVEAKMTNELIPTPNTGSDANIGGILAITAMSIFATEGLVLVLFKRRKRNFPLGE